MLLYTINRANSLARINSNNILRMNCNTHQIFPPCITHEEMEDQGDEERNWFKSETLVTKGYVFGFTQDVIEPRSKSLKYFSFLSSCLAHRGRKEIGVRKFKACTHWLKHFIK